MDTGENQQTTPELQPPSGEQRTWAVLAHMLALAGNLIGLGWIGPLVVWVKCRSLGPFVSFHALQAMFFQLGWSALMFGLWRVDYFLGNPLFNLLIAASIVPVAWNIIAAIRSHNGEWYQYPCAGRWAQELVEQS
jgi:uncharacterized Tic20 family protein